MRATSQEPSERPTVASNHGTRRSTARVPVWPAWARAGPSRLRPIAVWMPMTSGGSVAAARADPQASAHDASSVRASGSNVSPAAVSRTRRQSRSSRRRPSCRSKADTCLLTDGWETNNRSAARLNDNSSATATKVCAGLAGERQDRPCRSAIADALGRPAPWASMIGPCSPSPTSPTARCASWMSPSRPLLLSPPGAGRGHCREPELHRRGHRAERQTTGAVLGLDSAGTVVRAAADGSGLSVGSRMAGFGPAAWAQRHAVSTSDLAAVPEGVDLADAAAMPAAGVTAFRQSGRSARCSVAACSSPAPQVGREGSRCSSR